MCACPRPRRGGLEEATSVLFSFPDDFMVAMKARRAANAPPQPLRRKRLVGYRGHPTRCRWRGPSAPKQGGLWKAQRVFNARKLLILSPWEREALLHIVKTAFLPSPCPQQHHAHSVSFILALLLRVGCFKVSGQEMVVRSHRGHAITALALQL